MKSLLQLLLAQNAVQTAVASSQAFNLMMKEQFFTRIPGGLIAQLQFLPDIILLDGVFFSYSLGIPNIVAFSKGIQMFCKGLVKDWTLSIEPQDSKQPCQVIFCHYFTIASQKVIDLPQVFNRSFLLVIQFSEGFVQNVNLPLIHIKTDLAQFLYLFDLVLEIPCDDVLQINGESKSSLIILPFQSLLIQFRVFFRKQLLRQPLQGDYAHPILIEVPEDEVEFILRRVNPIFEHEL